MLLAYRVIPGHDWGELGRAGRSRWRAFRCDDRLRPRLAASTGFIYNASNPAAAADAGLDAEPAGAAPTAAGQGGMPALRRYRVLHPATVKAEFAKESHILWTLLPGLVVEAAELRNISATGQMRVRLTGLGGWASLASGNGTVLLEELPPLPPAAPAEAEAAERYVALLQERCSTPECGPGLDRRLVAAVAAIGKLYAASPAALVSLVVTGWGRPSDGPTPAQTGRRNLSDGVAATTSFFVDTVCGKDASDGRSPGSAMATAASAVAAARMLAGSSEVLLRVGQDHPMDELPRLSRRSWLKDVDMLPWDPLPGAADEDGPMLDHRGCPLKAGVRSHCQPDQHSIYVRVHPCLRQRCPSPRCADLGQADRLGPGASWRLGVDPDDALALGGGHPVTPRQRG